MLDDTTHILKVKCNDSEGLIAKITGVISGQQLNILKSDEFVDNHSGSFFFRIEFCGNVNEAKVKEKLRYVLNDESEIDLIKRNDKKLVVLATKEHHCLSDLLIQDHYKELGAQVQCVISNHNDLRGLTEKFDINYFEVPTTGLGREEHEEKVADIIKQNDFDYIVLAKYMRILTPEFVNHFENKIINIHHSFLPAFIGANPYKQAFERGVKIIGATAHFVNEDLDDGPIIEQQVIRIDHQLNWKDMRKLGRDVERDVLNKALKKVLQEKVFQHGRKTIVF